MTVGPAIGWKTSKIAARTSATATKMSVTGARIGATAEKTGTTDGKTGATAEVLERGQAALVDQRVAVQA